MSNSPAFQRERWEEENNSPTTQAGELLREDDAAVPREEHQTFYRNAHRHTPIPPPTRAVVGLTFSGKLHDLQLGNLLRSGATAFSTASLAYVVMHAFASDAVTCFVW